MGVRIEAYAVDLPPFTAFLDTPLGDLLQRYQRDGKDPSEQLRFTGIDNDDTFFASPGGSIGAWIGSGSARRLEELTEKSIREIEALQIPAREHLSRGSIYQASWLLRGFTNCRGIHFAERLLDGERLQWIGSVLQFAHNTWNGANMRNWNTCSARSSEVPLAVTRFQKGTWDSTRMGYHSRHRIT